MQFPITPDIVEDVAEDVWMGMYAMPQLGLGGYHIMPPDLLIEVYTCMGCGKDIDKLETFINAGKWVYHVDCFTTEVKEEKVAVTVTYEPEDAGGE